MTIPSLSNTTSTTSDESVWIFPASFAQQRLWFLEGLQSNTATYNLPATIRLTGALNVEVLQQSINAIIQRHEVLRTTFRSMDGQLMQVIAARLTVPLPLVDVQNVPEDMREDEVRRLTIEEAHRPFDLARGPLTRATLLRLGAEEHTLLVTIHHMICDAWSMSVFLRELAAHYEAFSTGQPVPLPDLPVQYVDFTVWQREWLHGEVLEAQIAYWKKQLQGAPEVLELPTDRPRPPIPTRRGSIYRFTLSKHLTDALRALSRQEGVTLYMTLLAAFNTLLHRYTGQDDMVIGSPVAGRRLVEFEALIGLFINTLALRADLSDDPTFRQLLARVREVSLEAQAHQDVPFEHLVQALQPERNLSHSPLVQVLMSLQPSLSGLPLGWTLNHTGTSQFDLSLICEDRPQGLVGWFEYNTDLFDPSTIARMAGHWQTLLERITDHPEQHLSELPLLTDEERQQLLVDWNATQTEYPADRCIHQLIEAQVLRTPDAAAVVCQGQQLTYRELNARANQLARHLQRLGVGPDVPVGLCVERSLEMMVGLLGILKAGGTYVPLDPIYPRERLAFMLHDARAPILLTQQRLMTRLPVQAATVICLDTESDAWSHTSPDNPGSGVTAQHLAYIIYTSGSTGKPKGVQIPHRALVNFMLSMQRQLGLTADDRVLAVTTVSFDIAALEVFLPLLVGASVIIAPREVLSNGQELAEALARSRATVMQATPATWRLLLAAGWQGDRRLTILCGGEALPSDLANQLLQRASSLWNLYGPTETTIWSTAHKVEVDDRATTIGRPIANTQVYLLDRHLHPVPIGVPGELYLGGDGLARGYVNRPELTAERFIRHPFSRDQQARLYRTGDLVRYRPEGNLEFLGRVDEQVKIRGIRIEPGEIETVLSQHPAVLQAVVVAREDTPGDTRLVAYIVPGGDLAPNASDLRSYLQQQLPYYMVPAAFVLLDALPLMPNGKVDRRRLPAPDPAKLAVREAFVAPTSLLQHQLVWIWEELLDVRPIGIRDNFFYLGGHSLLAARLVERVEQAYGKRIPLATLFAGPTIEDLAKALQSEAQEGAGGRTPVVAVQASGSKRPFFYLHGVWNGEGFYCFQLARRLGPEQPFYALEPYHFDGLRVAPTMEAVAAAHLESLRAVQPEGPYMLGGFCVGGVVAYEMARQLRAEGQRVDLLVLIDPAYPPVVHRAARALSGRVGNLLGLGADKQLESFLRLRHVYKFARHQRRWEDVKAFTANDPSIETLLPTGDALRGDTSALFNWVTAGYSFDAYPGKVVLLWARDEPFAGVWRRKAALEDNVELRVIPGTHRSCLVEHVQTLAEELSACLTQAQPTA